MVSTQTEILQRKHSQLMHERAYIMYYCCISVSKYRTEKWISLLTKCEEIRSINETAYAMAKKQVASIESMYDEQIKDLSIKILDLETEDISRTLFVEECDKEGQKSDEMDTDEFQSSRTGGRHQRY
eukprot:scaffold123677_cov34-Attheya_sp.AAC.1